MRRNLNGAVALGILLMAACAAPSETTSPASDTGSAVLPDTRPQTAPKTAASSEVPQTAARTVGPAPEKIIGMTNDDITTLFGRPVFVRRDPPGEFWRYRAKSCVLELYFYRQAGTWRVNHMEMRRGDAPVTDQPACITALRTQPQSG